MTNSTTEVLVYIKTTLKPGQLDEIASQIKTISGVSGFSLMKEKPNLVRVVYNTTQTRVITILNKFTRLGYNAALVGM